MTPGLDGVSRAVNEAERGLLPARPRSSAASRARSTPPRAARASSIIWIQLQELPPGASAATPRGDRPATGAWTDALREAYADRICARLGESIENLDAAILDRVVLSPADLERLNVNLVGGDIYGGSCALDQNLLWRPFPQAPGHRTADRRAYGTSARARTPARAGRRFGLSRREGAHRPAPLARRPAARADVAAAPG